jgi:hypothetical protein
MERVEIGGRCCLAIEVREHTLCEVLQARERVEGGRSLRERAGVDA